MSMGFIFEPGQPFVNVAANAKATTMIPPGKTINALQFALGGTTFTKSHISLIKLLANTRSVLELSGDEMDKLAAYRGITSEANYLDFCFLDTTGLDQVDQEVGAFDTSVGVSSITMEVTIGAATAPTLRHQLDKSAPQVVRDGKGLSQAPYSGMISKALRYPWQASTGGRLPIQLPFGRSGSIIKRIHITQASGAITGVTCKEDSVVVHESLKLDNEHFLKKHSRVPQSLMYSIDFVARGGMKDAWDTRHAGAVNLFLDLSSADSGNVIVEFLDPLNNL